MLHCMHCMLQHHPLMPCCTVCTVCSSTIRSLLHPSILITSGGGGIGSAASAGHEFDRAAVLAECASIDVLGLHCYSPPAEVDKRLNGYISAIGRTRLLLQEWGVVGTNSTAQAVAFTSIARIAAMKGVPQFVCAMQPSHLPLPSTQLAVSAPLVCVVYSECTLWCA
jgi:hypothetical protein